MSNSNRKEPIKRKPIGPKLATIKPETVKDQPEEKIDLAKAFDWTKKYSYDPEGLTYIRSMPTDNVIDPKDDPALNGKGSEK